MLMVLFGHKLPKKESKGLCLYLERALTYDKISLLYNTTKDK